MLTEMHSYDSFEDSSNSNQYICSLHSSTTNKLCRQLSIESPGPIAKDCVFNFEVPVPEVPPCGARIKVVCAGACYRIRNRSASVSSVSSSTSNQSVEESSFTSVYHGIRDGALFPGFEVSGVVDELGSEVKNNDKISVGQRVVLFPFDGIPDGYAEYITVPDLQYLVPIPDNMLLSVAAMLPSGALIAKNAIMKAHEYILERLNESPANQECKMLIVGTGGLALWAIKIAEHHFKSLELKCKVNITVASLKDEGFKLAKQLNNISIVQWNEEVYEKQLIERTKDACRGPVDIVIDFGTTSRSLHRSLQCLNTKGIVLVNEEVAERLLPKFSRLAAEKQQKIVTIPKGTVEHLQELVQLVAAGEIVTPPYTEFSVDDAATVIQKLCDSEIPGRAIFRFHDIQ